MSRNRSKTSGSPPANQRPGSTSVDHESSFDRESSFDHESSVDRERSFDRESQSDRMPSFWGASQTRAWEENREDLQRAWDPAPALPSTADSSSKEPSEAMLAASRASTPEGRTSTGPIPVGMEPAMARAGEISDERPTDWFPGKPWNSAQSALRFGVGAASFWAGEPWSPQLEQRLRDEWATLGFATTWDEARALARYGWDTVNRKRGS